MIVVVERVSVCVFNFNVENAKVTSLPHSRYQSKFQAKLAAWPELEQRRFGGKMLFKKCMTQFRQA